MLVLDRVVRWCVALGLAGCVVVALLAPRNSWFVFQRPVVLLAFTGGVVSWVLLRRMLRLPGRVGVGVAVGWVLGAAQGLVSLGPYGWDAGGVQQRAEVLAAGGTLAPEQLEYFAWYPNNLVLAAAEIAVIRAGSWVGLPGTASLFALNLVLYAVLLWAVGAALLVAGRPAAVWPAQGAVVLLIGLSPVMTVPYSDLPAATGVAVCLVLAGHAVRSGGRRRLAWAALAGVSLGVAIALKPFVIALAVAVLLVGLTPVARGARVPVLIALAGVALTVPSVAAAGEAGAGLSRTELRQISHPFPAEHFLAMGTYDSDQDSPVRRYGAFSQAQVDATAAIKDPDERRAALTDTVRGQVQGRSVAENVRFFTAKVAWVWGDGTFWAQGEGRDHAADSYYQDGLLRDLGQVTRAPGAGYLTKASFVQGLWLALLAGLSVALLRAPASAVLTTLALSLGGVTGYLMLFEARPRYLIAVLPIVIILTGLTHHHPEEA